MLNLSWWETKSERLDWVSKISLYIQYCSDIYNKGRLFKSAVSRSLLIPSPPRRGSTVDFGPWPSRRPCSNYLDPLIAFSIFEIRAVMRYFVNKKIFPADFRPSVLLSKTLLGIQVSFIHWMRPARCSFRLHCRLQSQQIQLVVVSALPLVSISISTHYSSQGLLSNSESLYQSPCFTSVA